MIERQTAPDKMQFADREDRALSEPRTRSASWAITLATFGFALLQSVCTAILALSGLRLLIGAGAFAFAWSGILLADRLHGEAIRLPMTAFAVVGSVVNLYAVWRVRSLRRRASSAWRVKPAAPEQKRREVLQVAIAVLTLLLVAVEWAAHVQHFGSIFS